MADAVVSFAVETLGQFLIQEVKFLHGVRDQVEEIKKELELVKCFLKDADQKRSRDTFVQNCVSQIREASYDAEDVIERFFLKAAQRAGRSDVLSVIKRGTSCIRETHIVGREIEGIKNTLSTLRARLQEHGVIKAMEGSSFSDHLMQVQPRKRQSYAHNTEPNVVGLDHKIEELVGQLLNQENPYKVVSVYGIGGSGKTTLAKEVYHDSKIRNHFEGFAWVYISQQCKPKDVWKTVLIQLTSASDQQQQVIARMEDGELTRTLFELQKEKECLVVIDDIWKSQDWDNISIAFPYMNTYSKSKILLTTRKKEVASRADRGAFHNKLHSLDDKTSLDLLERTVKSLGGDAAVCNESIEQFGKEMVKHCAGLPLAIVVLGGVLAKKNTLSGWKAVNDNIKGYLRRGNAIEDDSMGVTEVLALSFEDLPYQLKPCFLYISRFPEDYEIKARELTRMWMAEGLIKGNEVGDITTEDVAEQYLNELADRCMIEIGKEGSSGKIKTFRMHDLMQEMCMTKAREERFLHAINRYGVHNESLDSSTSSLAAQSSTFSGFRRFSMFVDKDSFNIMSIVSAYHGNPKLRAFVCCNVDVDGGFCEWKQTKSILGSFKLLRVLHIYGMEMLDKSLSRGIGTLIHLRYLSLRLCTIHELIFSSLENLVCLETLDLRIRNTVSKRGPINVVLKLKKLRRLYLPYRVYQCQPDSFQNLRILVNYHLKDCDLTILLKLTKLEKLDLVDVSFKELGQMFRTHRENVGFGHLRILRLRSELPEKLDLEAIVLGCRDLNKLDIDGPIEKFPEPSQFPLHLTKLALTRSRLEDPKAIEALGKLPNLKIMWLTDDAFIGSELVFHEGFSQLQQLMLSDMMNLEKWSVGIGAMPTLSRLVIGNCVKLTKLPDGLKYVTTIKEVLCRDMPQEFKERHQEGGDNFDSIGHVPSVIFNRFLIHESGTEIQSAGQQNRHRLRAIPGQAMEVLRSGTKAMRRGKEVC